jgi:hypothetical protein
LNLDSLYLDEPMPTPLIDQNAATRQKILGLIRRAQRRDATPLAQ